MLGTVTLHGEPGTGKELAARAIHAGSMRQNHRFLAINCANFGSEQLAGQLLGYKNGNLSEAILTRSGIFSADPVGTLLLDEVEKMPLKMQDQLLSILDMVDNQRSGSLKETGIDIRIRGTGKAEQQSGNDKQVPHAAAHTQALISSSIASGSHQPGCA